MGSISRDPKSLLQRLSSLYESKVHWLFLLAGILLWFHTEIAFSQTEIFAAAPAFEVSTVKPSDPNETGWTLGTKGNHFYARGVNALDLISFAYGLHAKQVAGGPAWIQTDKFDIEAVPNIPGRPRRPQLQTMLQKLLADRFGLAVHREQRELAVYALVPATAGARVRPTAEPEAPSGYDFPRIDSIAEMKVMRMSMADFASALQRTVVDRPVVDHTGLTDRYDFTLRWTPDESQFVQFRGTGVSVPAGNDQASGPPGLFTAIQEQLGLRLEPRREADEVVVIDQVHRPSAD